MKEARRSFVPLFVLLCGSLMMAQTAVTTYQNDNSHSGANTHETILTPSNVNVSTFGRETAYLVEGQVYAQPLYVPKLSINGTSHNVLFVATEHDQIYAFDANSGHLLWERNFLAGTGAMITVTTVSSSDVNCSDLTPEIGITGTPVINTATNTMYVVVETKEINALTHLTNFYHRLHALDIRTGRDVVSPHIITGTAKGTGSGSVNGIISFDPLLANQRPSLLLADGQVFVSWSSHCDLGNYHGWLMSFNQSTLAPTGILADTPNGYDGGFWGGGSGPAADANGSIYAATGNGLFDATSGGIDYGDSVIRFTWSSRRFLSPTISRPGISLSSTPPIPTWARVAWCCCPISAGQYPHLLIQVGKEGTIDLINRDNMGHWHSGNDDQIVQTLPYAIGGVCGGPAFWNNNAYFGGSYDYLEGVYLQSADRTAFDGSLPRKSHPNSFSYPGPTPSVSRPTARPTESSGSSRADTYPSTRYPARL